VPKYAGKTVAEIRLLCQGKKLSRSKHKKAELIQLILDNESVDVDAANVSSGDDVINNVVDGVDEIIDGGDDDEVVLPASGVRKPSSDVANLQLIYTQIRLAELD